MAITDYTSLQTAVLNWLNRAGDTDLIARVPEFISLAESEIDRRLRRTSARATITVSGYSNALPSDCKEVRSARLMSGTTGGDIISIVTPDMVSEFGMMSGSGTPMYGAIIEPNLLLAPAPSSASQVELIYFTKLIPLSGTNTTNVVLTEAPDLYLYGTLKQSAMYLENDERLQQWSSFFEDALAYLNSVRERAEYSASIRPLRVPVAIQ
jgi:hypothetical protein